MRALPFALLVLAGPADAAIRSMAECRAAIAADANRAREEAAQWVRFGGGAEARVCEARALEALGARKNAAVILTETASDRGNGLPAATRANLLREAGRLWLALGEPALANATLSAVLEIVKEDADTLALRAEALGRLRLWPAAVDDLTRALALDPARADILALRAAARRRTEDKAGALADAEAALAILPHLPEALFEKGASLALLGRTDAALDVWFRLIELHPDSEMAALARRNIQQLAGQ